MLGKDWTRVRELLAGSLLFSYNSVTEVFNQGEPARYVYIVLDGSVRELRRGTEDGRVV